MASLIGLSRESRVMRGKEVQNIPIHGRKKGKMRLSIRGMVLALAILWGAVVLVTGLANLIWTGYGAAFLQILSSVYPGYKASGSMGDLMTGVLYSLVDGALIGLVFAWLYNRFAGRQAGLGGDVKREAGVRYPPIEPRA
jgi:hypothetical protein